MIRICIVDDHALVRAGLAQLLGTMDDATVVGCATDGGDAVEVVARHRPDVVLMDLSMPVLDGVAATRAITALTLDASVVVLTCLRDRERIGDALDAGAVGYVLKDAAPVELFAAIRAAAGGPVLRPGT